MIFIMTSSIGNKIVYLAGPDGSGKTTLLKEIESNYKRRGISTKHIWLRSPKLTSKPLMLYCRLAGLTKYKTINGIKYGKHEFYRSKFVSSLFPFLQLFDFKIKWKALKKQIKNNDVILFDRFSLDTLADLMVDTGRMDLYNSKVGAGFLNLIPKHAVIVLIIANEEAIRKRKEDTKYDDHLAHKIEVFKQLGNALNLPVIDNNGPFEKVKTEVFRILEQNERN